MHETIYVDVLVVLNLFVNYFLLLATSLFLHRDVHKLRMIASATLGGVCSIIIFWQTIPSQLLFVLKFAIGALMAWVCFGYHHWRMFLTACGLFLTVSFLFAGLMLFLWFTITPGGMYYNNGVVYFNVSAVFITASSVVAYLILWCLDRLRLRFREKEKYCDVRICQNGNEVLLRGFVDTGNTVKDVFSGKRVVICRFDSVKTLIPPSLYPFFNSPTAETLHTLSNHPWACKIKAIPFQGVGQQGMLYAFAPEQIYAVAPNGMETPLYALVGVSAQSFADGAYDALLYPFHVASKEESRKES